jgi:antirestriction protein ArdC
MPSKASFIDTKTASATENFYSVLLHELTHWTGAPNRLNRVKGSLFGSPEYAFEELIAELGAAYACNHLNISSTPREDHAHYLKSWCKAIREHKQALLKASGCASKALQYMIDLQKVKTNKIQEAA